MSNEKSHKIDAIKYFVPLPEGDYDFQEHLTDYLLTDILNANKQLEKYEARVKELEEKLKRKTQECEQIKEKYEALKLENQEGYEIVAELKHEYEGLKKQLETAEEWRIKAESLNEKLELKNTCYLEALDEIEKELKEDVYCESQECGCDDFEECLKCTKEHILYLINKAKDCQ